MRYQHDFEQLPVNLGPCYADCLARKRRAFACMIEIKSTASMKTLYSASSAGVRVPSFAFRRNSPTWASNSGSARSSRRTEAIFGVKASVSGSSQAVQIARGSHGCIISSAAGVDRRPLFERMDLGWKVTKSARQHGEVGVWPSLTAARHQSL